MNCIVIDDEAASRRVIEHFINDTEVLSLKGSFNNPLEAFKYLQLHTDIDLLFLDINMPQQTGLEFYKSLNYPPSVIFTTAYPQYAVNAFDLNAVDYLLKPISYERFLVAINKVLKARGPNQENESFITLKENKTYHKVLFDNIFYLEALGDYVKVISNEGNIITHSTFSKLLNQFPSNFIRIHKSFCVNKQYITKLNANQLTLKNTVLPIGQTYKKNVLSSFNI